MEDATRPLEEPAGGAGNGALDGVMMGGLGGVGNGGNGGNGGVFAAAIAKVAPAVVVLRVNYVRAFDGEGRGCSSATGFVVDKEKGLILTNRHVVSCGPVRADATFLSKEEVEIKAIFRDPVHDYGVFQFDPKEIKFQEVVEIPLSPERAEVGLEVRLLGNDAGEKLSILSGTLARLDRVAPHYGSKEYNDHNTFYYAAASSTSGGSSGSPVIDSDGHAVAINAGGKTKAASSFYLPLDRVVRALSYLRKGETVPRRTLQVIFKHQAFTEALRLGLSRELEAEIRKEFPKATGLLVADQVVPGGPGARAGVLPGDILLELNGKHIHEFLPLEAVLDDSESVKLTLRRGDETLTVELETVDLHALTPSSFLEISGAVIHPLSYMQAINNAIEAGSVYISSSGFMLGRANVPWNAIILAVGDEETPDIATFERVIAKYPDLSTVSVRYAQVTHRHHILVRSITVDRTWFVWRHAQRCDKEGTWHFRNLASPSIAPAPKQHTIHVSDDKRAGLVMVLCDVPFLADGIPSSNMHGTGTVVDAENGLVVVDRNTVPNTLCNVSITFCGTAEISARVLLVHPLHNFSIIQYDPSLLQVEFSASNSDSNDEATREPEPFRAEFALSPQRLAAGDATTFAGLSHQMTTVEQSCKVTNVERLMFSLTSPPRFTAPNQLVIHVDKLVSNVGGVLLDDENRVQAFWWSFSYQSSSYKDKEIFVGVHADFVYETVNALKANGCRAQTSLPTLGLDLVVTPISKARAGMGLSSERVRQFASAAEAHNQVLTVRSALARSHSFNVLRSGDILLDINKTPMITFEAVQQAVFEASANNESDAPAEVAVTVLRDLREQTFQVPLSTLSFIGTSRLVLFAGMFIQEPHTPVFFRGFDPGTSVYCSRWFYGSPAHKYDLKATHFILGINDHDTPTLDDLVRVVSELKDGEFVRIRTISLKEKKRVFTLKCDYHYWPTVDLVRDAETSNWTLRQG
ncbi:Pro-apoptotic serine protease nma111 [Hondaea fermentalgiana]|uniref:Pro-apoptotic serine protease NMA111 n=1 Tax=Hondaea fermentalgiana TaxID=2315210 RepID=A0A2R5GV67_9STRA|nr:Pro-apoptotic serine protease nma111 [Hondaea fermentalgiana]|eukprot:GBG32291.1 Pro-apoptotic serine protease nma111 [Hondaea fermentalgiana]